MVQEHRKGPIIFSEAWLGEGRDSHLKVYQIQKRAVRKMESDSGFVLDKLCVFLKNKIHKCVLIACGVFTAFKLVQVESSF